MEANAIDANVAILPTEFQRGFTSSTRGFEEHAFQRQLFSAAPQKPVYQTPLRQNSITSSLKRIDHYCAGALRNLRARIIRILGIQKGKDRNDTPLRSLNLPHAISQDVSEIEYLRRTQQEALMKWRMENFSFQNSSILCSKLSL